MISNTTPTPNIIFDEWLPELTKGELKVLLVVTRQTLGWAEDNDTTGRKEKDWISQKQFCKKTGLGTNAIAEGIDGLVKKKMIEVIDKEGSLLDTKQKRQRIGRKRGCLFYRLRFRNETTLVSKGNQLQVLKQNSTKETLITKKTLTKEVSFIINYLNKKTDKHFSIQNYETIRLIAERLTEGRTVEDFKNVINTKVADWSKEPQDGQQDMKKYLRPKTLFAPVNFENYINESPRRHIEIPYSERPMISKKERFERCTRLMKGVLSREDIKTAKQYLEKYPLTIGTVFDRDYVEEVLSGKREI